ncbi:MAG: response regulator transcription factor [Chloroflexi bacterium]|nr:response regulator transcription factor [Chloroflexota bacterium]
MTARVLVVDDHVLVRQGIVRLLQDEADIEVVGEASNGFEAVNKAKELEVDIVLMDLYMSGLDGVATTRLIKRELPNVDVIIITASDEEDDLFEAIQAGARGYVMKSVDISDLIQQIRQVLTGGVGMTDDLTTKLVTGLARRGSKGLNADLTEQESLTVREKEVLELIAQGATNKEIAASLFISENTVRAHVRTLMQKLHMDNRTQLAVYGVHEGYTVNGRAGNPKLGVSRKQAAAARPR